MRWCQFKFDSSPGSPPTPQKTRPQFAGPGLHQGAGQCPVTLNKQPVKGPSSCVFIALAWAVQPSAPG
eukprot:1787387-Alexandrium_andersonii.AAC.1